MAALFICNPRGFKYNSRPLLDFRPATPGIVLRAYMVKTAKKSDASAPRLQALYADKIRADLQKQFGYANPMQIPKLEKIVINMGLGQAVDDSKVIDAASQELALISGQKPIVTLSRKSIAGFKLRENLPIGAKVTLRKQRMYEFLDRLITMAMPRIRDFRGVSNKSFDGRGNYTFGLKEQLIFPEIHYDKVDKVRGMDISFITSAKNDEEAKALLAAFQFPFIK